MILEGGSELAIAPLLDAPVGTAWRYASEIGRAFPENREPLANEAELFAPACAAVSKYPPKKQRTEPGGAP